ncbi:type IX secretion system protein PorG [Chitinophaga lutea]
MQPTRTLKTVMAAAGVLVALLSGHTSRAQYEERYVGELGFTAGGAHYFGDLNTHGSLRAVKPTVGIFYRKYFNGYVGARAHFRYMALGYSDVYNTNDFQQRRNLSFNTHLFELAVQGDFNFFKFEPGSQDNRFSPYLTLGASAFHFNPYAYYQGEKYFLQPLKTEGQGMAIYPDRKPYSLYGLAFLIGGGLKYSLNRRINLGLECLFRFAQTDYLDDVSTTYAGISNFATKPDGSSTVAAILQDRSYVMGTPIGDAGRQRGNSRDKDQFATLELTLGILFSSYRCKF